MICTNTDQYVNALSTIKKEKKKKEKKKSETPALYRLIVYYAPQLC